MVTSLGFGEKSKPKSRFRNNLPQCHKRPVRLRVRVNSKCQLGTGLRSQQEWCNCRELLVKSGSSWPSCLGVLGSSDVCAAGLRTLKFKSWQTAWRGDPEFWVSELTAGRASLYEKVRSSSPELALRLAWAVAATSPMPSTWVVGRRTPGAFPGSVLPPVRWNLVC